MNIDSLGTVRRNRINDCPHEPEKLLLKRGRGSYDYRLNEYSGIIVFKWTDNKVVCSESSFCGLEPMKAVKLWNTIQKRKIDVTCPNIVSFYNNHMGGVDLAGMLVELYRVPLK
ncbi:piggyBac transposable element-derived protein 3-like [Schistocerca nitens]|uniref:piggyBac transposable element-derived protein 3-like n=1 Tax=Schistocerca nitens TaxID=7011 RepID=UPI002117ADE0|nr:piggyBac transposable element-derived protein 3-like [Schistocerca nitens]